MIFLVNDEPGVSKQRNFRLFLRDTLTVSNMTHQFVYLRYKTLCITFFESVRILVYLEAWKLQFKQLLCYSILQSFIFICYKTIWRPPSLSELTPMIFYRELTHLVSESSIWFIRKYYFNKAKVYKNLQIKLSVVRVSDHF